MSRAAADSLQRPRCSKGCINVYFSQQSTSCGSVAVQFKLPAWTRSQASLLIWEKKKKILKRNGSNLEKDQFAAAIGIFIPPWVTAMSCILLVTVAFICQHSRHILPTGNGHIGWYFGRWFHCCARETITWKCQLFNARNIQVLRLWRLKIKCCNQHCYVAGTEGNVVVTERARTHILVKCRFAGGEQRGLTLWLHQSRGQRQSEKETYLTTMINTAGAEASPCFFWSYQIISVRVATEINKSIKLKMKIEKHCKHH